MGCICGSSKMDKPKEIPSVYYNKFEQDLPNVQGKIIAITGCTTGTGFQCAMAASLKGAKVIMLNRQSQRQENAFKKIKDTYPQADLEYIPCDLSSFESIKRAAEELNSKYGQTGIDVLCNNAGVMANKDEATIDGCDIQMQTNHLSHFLLTNLIFPLLETAANTKGEARIVNHSSIARQGCKLESKYFGKNGGKLGGDGNSMFFKGARWVRYSQTKLANVIFTQALHQKLTAKGSKVKALVCAPGLSNTELQVKSSQHGGFTHPWLMSYGQSMQDGTMPLLHCCFNEATNEALWEPINTSHMKGPVGQTPFTKIEKDHDQYKLLWEESEKTCDIKWNL